MILTMFFPRKSENEINTLTNKRNYLRFSFNIKSELAESWNIICSCKHMILYEEKLFHILSYEKKEKNEKMEYWDARAYYIVIHNITLIYQFLHL